jgi:hypothetical protein
VTSDLATLLAECGRLDPYLACGIGRSASHDPALWLTAEGLAADPAGLDRLADAYARRWEIPGDRASQATIIVLDYTWYATAPLVAAWLVGGVVPSLSGAEVWLDPETREGSLALGTTELVPPSNDALRATIEAHLEPLVEAIAARRWIGRRTAWMGVGDRVVGAIEHVERILGTPERAPAEADRIVHRPGTALDSPRHRFIGVPAAAGERTVPVGLRASCCRFYRVPGVEMCVTCPLVPVPERDARLGEWVAELEMAPVSAD